MKFKLRHAFGLSLVLGALIAVQARAEITVDGLDNRAFYHDYVAFKVITEPGFQYLCELDSEPVAAGEWIEVSEVDYHELYVVRTNTANSDTESRLIQFIVQSSARGNSERGLPPWTPYPTVNSSEDELAGAELRIITPAQIPTGGQIPVIGLVENTNGGPVRVNGDAIIVGNGMKAFKIRRGVGSCFVKAPSNPGGFSMNISLSSMETRKSLLIESGGDWSAIAGTVSDTEVWQENSEIHITNDITIPAGAELRIESGTFVKLDPRVNIHVNGKLRILGTVENPVLLAPSQSSEPWGGFLVTSNSATLEVTGAIITGGGGDPGYFDDHFGVSHRPEQAVLLGHHNATVTVTNSYLISNAGQAANGYNSEFMFDNTLIQRCITTGEFEGGLVVFNKSALIEFPVDSQLFLDQDNDAVYFTEGEHFLYDSLIGWAKDDGIDSGSGGAGSVVVSNCWIEACYHEGMAWSGGGREIDVANTVVMNCGQGIEAGWGTSANSPDVFAENLLAVCNAVGARFGDNYNWTYPGRLTVTNSYLLYNLRDIFGRAWGGTWQVRSNSMFIDNNYISSPNNYHTNNTIWNPSMDGHLLAGFLTTPPDAQVGVAFAVTNNLLTPDNAQGTVYVGLSTFSTNQVKVDYTITTGSLALGMKTLTFHPGEIIKGIDIGDYNLKFAYVSLHNPVNSKLTTPSRLYITQSENAPTSLSLINTASNWRYLDGNRVPETNWASLEFDDTNWETGHAEFGFGDNDEVTVIDGGPDGGRYPTAYFRHRFPVDNPADFSSLALDVRYDDGVILYLNNNEIFRGNMPDGPISHDTYTGNATESETAFVHHVIDTDYLEPGGNIIAAEVHQSSPDSSDLSFDLGLKAIRRYDLTEIQYQRFGDEIMLYWQNPNFTLQQSTSLNGPWELIRPLQNPVSIGLDQNDNKFFRLRDINTIQNNGMEHP
ncbi:MAG: right-handed parallel beta-helix repeat-containing protein [Verrucomicrobia bacterium]|nr:right-handed parallel beta-helix repeat-containing protein [Verrucomicrobiota bacterium]MCF7707439.1 right-handed parallel beta-helix repeat-containing protein [Verrucomicrobiota bacterium]